MITVSFDATSLGHNDGLERKHGSWGGIRVNVKANHILSEWMMQGIEESEKTSVVKPLLGPSPFAITQTHHTAGVLAILR